MESDKVEMKWYVLQAFSGFENKVKQTLEDTIKREGLEKSFGEILVPTEEVLEIKEGQKKRTERRSGEVKKYYQPMWKKLEWSISI